MKSPSLRRFVFRNDKGFALIIVLFFVVLMTGLTVAYLARAITARRVSDSSAAQAKALLLAQTAAQITVLDLKQEIIDGSTASSPATGVTIYTPKPPSGAGTIPKKSTMTPAIAAVSTFTPAIANGVETDGLANLLKISRNGVAFYTGGNYVRTGASRAPLTAPADASDSTMTPSLNGRYVSPSRWNSHYLIARDANASGNASTPTDNFTQQSTHSKSLVPDWILVTRDGTNPKFTGTPDISSAQITNYSGTADTVINPSPANNSYVIGRYAYAIYNEGGLLDMNVAGYPSKLTQAQIGSYKNSVAMADLTQLASLPTTLKSVSISSQDIDNIVAWRNHYTAQFTGASSTYPAATFTTVNAGSWLTNFVQYNSTPTNLVVATQNGTQVASANNYLGVNTNTLSGSSTATDQAFLSRQQLISLSQALNISPDALQYLGTFSRALEQPSYTPDPARPKTLSPSAPAPLPSVASSYAGNNYDPAHSTTLNDDETNPAFPSIRVTTPFTRWNGTQAILGEPLVKTRFALSHLAMFAYGSSAAAYPTNATAKALYATSADTDPIYNRFGLTWDDTNKVWTYSHGQNYIMALKDVAAAGREPDFAELLKASIAAGSLGKGAPNLGGSGDLYTTNFQYGIDTNIDLQILQIMANLIDQQDKDSFPTRIQLKNNSYIVCGIEDLPYIYRYHTMSLVDRKPTPLLSATTDKVVFPQIPANFKVTGTITGIPGATWTLNAGSIPNAPYTFYGAKDQATAGPLSDSGEATHLFVMDLWNPHDLNCLANETTTLRPTLYRISAQTVDPYKATPPWYVNMLTIINSNLVSQKVDSSAVTLVQYVPLSSTMLTGSLTNGSLYVGGAAGNTGMTFKDSNGKLFREPTLLWHNTSANALAGPASLTLPPVCTPNPVGGGPLGMPTAGLTDAVGNAGKYFGIVAGQMAISEEVKFTCTYTGTANPPPANPPEYDNKTYIFQSNGLRRPDPGYTGEGPSATFASNFPEISHNAYAFPVGGATGQITFLLEYSTNNGATWIPYDWKYPDFKGVGPGGNGNGSGPPNLIVNTTDFPGYTPTWQNMQAMTPGGANSLFNPASQIVAHGAAVDPRISRWGMAKWGIDPAADAAPYDGGFAPIDTSAALDAVLGINFSVINTASASTDKGLWFSTGVPASSGSLPTMRWFDGPNSYFFQSNATPHFYPGMLAFNNPAFTVTAQDNSTQVRLFYEDPDGIARRAMGAYAKGADDPTTLTASGPSSISLDTATGTAMGMPLTTANTPSTSPINPGFTANQQSQSRPFILNRPFRSVEEMSYAFTGTPWKNIDFFTPESGDVALLDTFCVNEPPSNGIVAGKVDLNTRQEPVLQAIEAGTYRDEVKNATTPPGYALPSLTNTEAKNVAQALVNYTSFAPTKAIAWRGPLANTSELVGKYVASPGTAITTSSLAPFTTAPDAYTYKSPAGAAGNGQTLNTYAGFSALLNSTVYTDTSTPYIQRLREAALRPLVDAGQTRVWNLLIDVVAQTGHYPKTAKSLDQFVVDGEKRIWLHVAIDRYTAQVIDKQVEVVSQ